MVQLSFTFEGRNQKLEKDLFFDQLRIFAEAQNWLPAVRNEVELLLEEWLTNIFNYGFTRQTAPQIQVAITSEKELARIEIKDNGIPFDPTKHPEPDLNLPPEERPIGGLGIFMVRKLSHGLRYERAGDWNRLIIEKNLAPPSLAPKPKAPQN